MLKLDPKTRNRIFLMPTKLDQAKRKPKFFGCLIPGSESCMMHPIHIRPPQDVDVRLVEFLVPVLEVLVSVPDVLLTKHEDHGRKLGPP